MIVDRKEKPARKIEIDLNGPEGNAFVLLGIVRNVASQLGYSKQSIDELLERMMESDYENLVNVADEEFGDFIIFYK